MISVSKPLKFLRPHYETMKSHYELMPESDLKVFNLFLEVYNYTSTVFVLSFFDWLYIMMQKLLADILSDLAWTISAEADRVRAMCIIYLDFLRSI